MKKRTLKLLTLSLILGISSCLTAQTFTIGADNGMPGPTNYPSPFGDYYKTMRAQYLYRASELTDMGMSAGFITEIAWNVAALPGTIDGTEDYTIKLLNSGTTSLGLTTWEEGATTVWGPTFYNPVLGINTFTLASPFFWDGVSSIIVEVCGGDFNATFTKNARVTWTGPLAFNGSHTRQSDTEPDPCGYTGTEYWENSPGGPDYRPQVIFTTIPGTDCAVVPSLGVTNTTATNVCIGEEFTLSVPPVAELGITYTWYSSPDGAAYSLIPGAVSSSLTTTQIATTLYRCKVTCTISGDFEVSSPVTVNQNDPTSCYCIPTYTTGTTEGDYISHAVLGTLNNTTGALPAPFYNYYTALSTDLMAGTSNTLSVTVGTYATQNGFAAWIDYNHNGVFEASEKLGEVTNLAAMATGNIIFTVPVTAATGTTRLRVREVWNQIGILPCDEYGFGETEDYNVNIIPGTIPTAAFTYAGDPTVTFTNTSTGLPTSYSWAFGDGGISTATNPAHLYATNGTYNVCLTATNLYGSNTACQNVVIDSYVPPVANFTFSGEPTVSFVDASLNSPTSWFWNFGDGGTSTLENPTHTYTYNGTFNVCMTATNATGSNTSCQFVVIDYYLAPVAAFTYSGDPTVSFTDASLNSPTSWFWNFGDGGTSTLENPSHLYASNGVYNVCLTATNATGSNTSCQLITIDSYLSPVAAFTFTGDPTVTYTDLSTNSPTSWAWSFGDGGVSTLENPTHTFTTNGTYNTCLTATNAVGSNTSCQDVIIDSYVYIPVADFTYTGDPDVEFTDISSNAPTTWAWDFGDGGTSSLENPIHLYASDGTYDVCLTAGNIAGSDTECKTIIVTGYVAPSALFSFSGDPVTTFTDLSTGSPNSWLWNFGDGGVSTLENPSHVYATNGIFNVCLSIVSPGGSDAYCTDVTIAGNGSAPTIDFSYVINSPTVAFTDLSSDSPSDWLWDFGDGAISGLQNPTHAYAVEAVYEVCLTATNDFGTNTDCKSINVTDNAIQVLDQITLNCYPNPAGTYTMIEGLPAGTLSGDIHITSVTGQEVGDNSIISWDNGICIINVSKLAAGTYTVKMLVDNQLFTGQFVKL